MCKMRKKLKVYLVNESKGCEFAVIWNNREEVLEFLQKSFKESKNDAINMIMELEDKEIIEWGFGWSFDKGETILNGLETIEYINKNNIKLKDPLVS